MSSTSPLAGRLATACWNGDLPSAIAAVADGVGVNWEEKVPGWGFVLPLAAAVHRQHHDVVVWLLSLGADPNGRTVMFNGSTLSTTAILQLLIDAGGDVNEESNGLPPLLAAVRRDFNREDNVRVLLAQPSLNVAVKWDCKTPEQHAPCMRGTVVCVVRCLC